MSVCIFNNPCLTSQIANSLSSLKGRNLSSSSQAHWDRQSGLLNLLNPREVYAEGVIHRPDTHLTGNLSFDKWKGVCVCENACM